MKYNPSMKKLPLLLLLSFSFVGLAYADTREPFLEAMKNRGIIIIICGIPSDPTNIFWIKLFPLNLKRAKT